MAYLDLARPSQAALVLLTSLGYVAATLGLKVVAGGHPAAGIGVPSSASCWPAWPRDC